MKTIFDHIEHVKGKPHHIRRQVAFTAAGCGAALIALVWLVGNVSLGTFAIKSTSFASATEGLSVVATDDSTAGANFAGVASAFPGAQEPARIEIVDVASSSVASGRAERTTIPF